MNKEMKATINSLTQSLTSQKEELSGNLAQYEKEAQELKKQLAQTKLSISDKKDQMTQLEWKLNMSQTSLH
jgi:chromosome segregation ATPase